MIQDLFLYPRMPVMFPPAMQKGVGSRSASTRCPWWFWRKRTSRSTWAILNVWTPQPQWMRSWGSLKMQERQGVCYHAFQSQLIPIGTLHFWSTKVSVYEIIWHCQIWWKTVFMQGLRKNWVKYLDVNSLYFLVVYTTVRWNTKFHITVWRKTSAASLRPKSLCSFWTSHRMNHPRRSKGQKKARKIKMVLRWPSKTSGRPSRSPSSKILPSWRLHGGVALTAKLMEPSCWCQWGRLPFSPAALKC